MKSGIRRKVDDLGRVVIPAGIRRSLGIREGDALEVSVQGDGVVLSKPVDQCVFCHSHQELHAFRAKAVCASCAVGVGMLEAGNEPSGHDFNETTSEASLSPSLDLRPAEPRAVVAHEGGLRVVKSEATTTGKRQEPPASTTAW